MSFESLDFLDILELVSSVFFFVLELFRFPLGIQGLITADADDDDDGVIFFILAKLDKCSKTFLSPSLYLLFVLALLLLLYQ